MTSPDRSRLIFLIPALKRKAWASIPIGILLAVSAVALTHPTAAWTSLILSGSILIVLGMIVAACYGSATRRPFRVGFTIAGASYLALFTLFPESNWFEYLATSNAVGWSYTKLYPNSTSNALPSLRNRYGSYGGSGGAFSVASPDDKQGSRIVDKETDVSDPSAPDLATSGTISTVKPAAADPVAGVPQSTPQQQQDYVTEAGNFWIIGHALWALILGWIGGCAAQYLARRQAKLQTITATGPKIVAG